ncbi:MAG TPA: hypothetical protein VFX59_06760 [Polyangiales bacterium]|nr:hypothetical protein [Polyangiales bacterium]
MIIVVVRAFSVLALVDLSGLTHTTLDLAGISHADDDCDDEQGHECPPGCTNCHCWHAGLATPPLAHEPPQVAVAPMPIVLPAPPYARTQPRAPDQVTLYRPPRARAFG